MKQIPNIFTLLNLFFGCLAIMYVLQPGLIPLYRIEEGMLTADVDQGGTQYLSIPEQIYMASVCIGIAALIDFLDGFIARLLKASSDMGKQLDSLADIVSFGVAPGMIIYQFLRLSFAQQENGLDISVIWLLPAFIIPCAGAYRLGRFNIDPQQSYGFKGVPIPAAGLLIASFPLIYWFSDYWFSNTSWIIMLLLNKWFWYAIIVMISYLMVSTLPMMALKFKELNAKKLLPFIAIAAIAIAGAIFSGWLAVPLVFIAYVLISLFTK